VIGDILQPTHLIFILVVALLVLGPKRLPEVGRSLGRGIRDFRNALSMDEPERETLPTQTQPQTEAPAAHSQHAEPATTQAQPEPVAVAHEAADAPS
jgi:sec-independent protein translocase protein TatA